MDASVVVKWFLPETCHQAALRLLRHYQDENLRLFAPALVMLEVSNALCKRVRRRELTIASAKEAWRLLELNSPILIDDRKLTDEAIPLSLASGQSLYDCLYLALALRQDCELITADRKFQAGMAAAFPNVVLL